ncbi:MAG TPA: hypothetical protein PKE42_00935 [Arachnia sp.]|nr:hypothetical protein [Arachnia sp.]
MSYDTVAAHLAVHSAPSLERHDSWLLLGGMEAVSPRVWPLKTTVLKS